MKLLVTGKGLVGGAVSKLASSSGHDVTTIGTECDLRNSNCVERLFQSEFDLVVHSASRVGGLGAHDGKHSIFLHDNLLMNTNVIEACRKFGVKKLVSISSVAAFAPDTQLLDEDMPICGPIHSSEYGYALSKRIMDEQIQLYRKEFGCDYCCVFPVNIYGPNDQFSLDKSHCVAALIRKFYEAKINNTDVEVWSDGLSIRQFVYSEDLAAVILEVLNSFKSPDRLIVSNPETFNIRQVAEIIAERIRFGGKILFDRSKPSGLRSRECKLERVSKFSSRPKTTLAEGVGKTLDWFYINYPNIRL